MPYKPEFAASIVQSLGHLQLADENLSDLKICIGHLQFHCHRFHMCACSEFFRVLLRTASEKGDTMPVVVLRIQGIMPDTFQYILDSIYRAENNLTEENMIDIWHAVSDLQINFLVSECEEFIINKISLDNYLNIYESAVLLKSEEVLASLYPFLVKHYNDFITSQTFVAMSLDWFKDFLGRCGSVIQPPDLVVESIIKWVSHVPETMPGDENREDLKNETGALNSKKNKRELNDDKTEFLKDKKTQQPTEAHKTPRRATEVVFERFHGKDGIKPKLTDNDTRRSNVGTLLKETNLTLVSRDCLKTLLETDVVMECKDARDFVNKTVANRIEARVPGNPKVTEKPPARYYLCILM